MPCCPSIVLTWIFANYMDRKPFYGTSAVSVPRATPIVHVSTTSYSVLYCNTINRWDLRSHPIRRTNTSRNSPSRWSVGGHLAFPVVFPNWLCPVASRWPCSLVWPDTSPSIHLKSNNEMNWVEPWRRLTNDCYAHLQRISRWNSPLAGNHRWLPKRYANRTSSDPRGWHWFVVAAPCMPFHSLAGGNVLSINERVPLRATEKGHTDVKYWLWALGRLHCDCEAKGANKQNQNYHVIMS